METIIITQANLDDAEEILELQKLCFQVQAKIYNDYNIPPITEDIKAYRKDFSNYYFLKAYSHTKIIGSVRWFIKDETAYISRLIVHPEYRDKGLGVSLMKEVEKRLSDIKRFELFTGYKSERNIYIYKKLGYNVFKKEKSNYDIELLFMEKVNNA